MGLQLVAGILGEPYFSSQNCLIYNIDCVEALKQLASSQTTLVDLTITSPPYNIGKSYETVTPVEEYVDWTRTWIDPLYKITKANGSFWLNLGYLSFPGRAKAIPIPYLLWDKIPFYLIQEVVWNYGAGVAARRSFSPRNEKFLWYVRNQDDYVFNLDAIRDPNVKYPNQKKGGVLRCNPMGKNPTDVWAIPKVTSGTGRSSQERTEHPAQFPLAAIERIIKGCSCEGHLILDPFLGSGTSAEAALRNNRKIIGFEKKQEYCQIAAERVRRTLDNLEAQG